MEWEEKEKIRMAIVTIHGMADYYAGLDMLCELVGWKSFRCEGLYPENEMREWLKRKEAGVLLQEEKQVEAIESRKAEVIPIKRKHPWSRCKECGRIPNPKKTGLRKYKITCPACGRGYNKHKQKGMEVAL